jgi:hypothetical protein
MRVSTVALLENVFVYRVRRGEWLAVLRNNRIRQALGIRLDFEQQGGREVGRDGIGVASVVGNGSRLDGLRTRWNHVLQNNRSDPGDKDHSEKRWQD